MPIRTVRVSSISGEIVPDSKAVMVRFDFVDKSRTSMKLDASEDELTEVMSHAEEIKARPERGLRRR